MTGPLQAPAEAPASGGSVAEEAGGEAGEGDVEVEGAGAGGGVVHADGGDAQDVLDLVGRQRAIGLEQQRSGAGDDGGGLRGAGALDEAVGDEGGLGGVLGSRSRARGGRRSSGRGQRGRGGSPASPRSEKSADGPAAVDLLGAGDGDDLGDVGRGRAAEPPRRGCRPR